nr:reverse transcriptase domain-containing protein [Tanacetum cinerariifolium]
MPRECLKIIEIKSKVRQSRAKAVVSKVSTSSSTLAISSEVAELKDMGITTRSGVAYQGPTIPTPSKVVKQGTDVTKDQVQTPCSQSTAHGQPLVSQSETLVSEPIAAPSKSKVRQSRAKAAVAKVGTSSSTPAVSSEVVELKDLVRALLLDKKSQSSAPVSSSTHAPVKAAAAANYNQGNTSFRPQMVANQIRPPSFPPHQNSQNNFNQGNNFNQNRGGNFNQSNFNQGGNFNQGLLHRPQVNQTLAYQAPAYQAPIPQTQSVSQTDFESYVKANDAVLRNMQIHGQNVQNQLANLTDMLSKFMSSNTASSSGGVAYQGPTNSTPSKIVKQGTEATKDQVQTPSSQSTTPVQPQVCQSETPTPISKPVIAPVSAPMPNEKSSIPYPSRRDNEQRRDQANEQIKKFYKIFKDMSFEISFTDALILMPKFASTLKALIGNKEKLSEMARTPMNEHCSTVILNKLLRKLGDPYKFLIPCEFPGMDECLALADL